MEVAAEDDLASQLPARSAQASVLASRGSWPEAEQLAREVVHGFSEAESPNQQGDAWIDLARVLASAGESAEAGDAARTALAFYERKGNLPASALTQAFIDELEGGESLV
jgi:hypothetical protein